MKIISLIQRVFTSKDLISGYEDPELIDLIFEKTKRYSPNRDWPEIRGAKAVLDYGGGCGKHYKEAEDPHVRWAVVETPAMVAKAQSLATNRLKFFNTVPEAISWLGTADLMHSDGAIQYDPDPAAKAQELASIGAQKLLWYRVRIAAPSTTVQRSNLVDNGPGNAPLLTRNKKVEYPLTSISEADFMASHGGYRLAKRDSDHFIFHKI